MLSNHASEMFPATLLHMATAQNLVVEPVVKFIVTNVQSLVPENFVELFVAAVANADVYSRKNIKAEFVATLFVLQRKVRE